MPPHKPRLFDDALLTDLATRYGTPLYVQDGSHVEGQIAKLSGFDVVRYAMKANSSLALLRRIRAAGAAVDCVSEGELLRAAAAGWGADQITFTADLFDRRALDLVVSMGVSVNLGSADMIDQYAERVSGGEVILRINPGFGHGHDRKVNTGGRHSKHGIWHEDLGAAVERAKRAGLTVSGLHMHIGSGSDIEHLRRVAGAMVSCARVVGSSLRMISGGGGLPTPYRASDPEVDVNPLVDVWREAQAEIESFTGGSVEVEVEPGRFVVAQGGLILSEVRGVKEMDGMPCILVDAGFHTLCRQMMYGSFHQISLVGKDERPRTSTMVAGPLCESSDVFTQGPGGSQAPQELPAAEVGDILCFHDTGAYGASMATGYNSMPIAAEVMVQGGRAQLVRPRQDLERLIEAEALCDTHDLRG